MPIAPKTPLNIIAGAMRLLGILQPGEVPSADDAADGLDRLNELIDAWKTERLMHLNIVPYSAPLVANQQSYTVGPGGTFVAPWPRFVQSASVSRVVSGVTTEYPLTILDAQAWAHIAVKGQKAGMPSSVYLLVSMPLMFAYFWPIPDGSLALTGILYIAGPLDTLTDLSAPLNVPPAILKALRYNLAADLAPDYLSQPRPDVIQIAVETKKWVKNNNYVITDMQLDPAVVLGRGR